MNLIKVFREELYISLIMFAVFSYDVYLKGETIANSMLISIIFLIITWAIFYFVFIRLGKDFKLDEREFFIFIQIGYISVFLFISCLIIIFTFQEVTLPLLNVTIAKIWGRYLLPIFILIHALTGLVYNYFRENF